MLFRLPQHSRYHFLPVLIYNIQLFFVFSNWFVSFLFHFIHLLLRPVIYFPVSSPHIVCRPKHTHFVHFWLFWPYHIHFHQHKCCSFQFHLFILPSFITLSSISSNSVNSVKSYYIQCRFALTTPLFHHTVLFLQNISKWCLTHHSSACTHSTNIHTFLICPFWVLFA